MAGDAESADDRVRLQFHYIKGPLYREVPCHGAIGGVTPQGKLWISFYAERYPLPRVVAYLVPKEEGQTRVAFDEHGTAPDSVDARSGVIRHVEFSTYIDMDVAVRLRDWLNTQITNTQLPDDTK